MEVKDTMASRANELLLCPENKSRYNSADIKSIFEYAKQLEGKTFEDILRNNGLSDDDIDFLKEKSMTNKGLLGNLIEEAWFGYPANSMQDADFDEVDAELKSTPFEGSGSKIRPGETVSVTQIDFTKPQEEDFYKSHAWKKIQMILLVYYLREKQRASILKSKLFYRIHYVFMIKPTQVDLAIIEADYKYLYGFIIRGEAEKLERSHGKYLGVAPKSNKNEEVLQYYGNHKPVHKKSFVLKKPYLRFILRVAAGIEEDCGSIIRDVSELQTDTMDVILEKRLSSYIGMEINVIWNMVKTSDETNMPSAKNEDAVVSCRMLGVKNNRVEEFVKAGIIPKVIKFRKKKSDNQQFRIEDIKFLEFNAEEFDEDVVVVDDEDEPHGWEASALYSYLAERQYFFIVFWDTDNGRIYKGCQLWGMPDADLEIVHQAWSKAKNIVKDGVKFDFKHDKNGKLSVSNNLPGMADNGVFHIRNHASKSFYVINGVSYGNGTLSDTDELPNGDRITKQAYWLNRSYIESQLRSDLVMQYD